MSEFIWDDKTVKEFVNQVGTKLSSLDGMDKWVGLEKETELFKQSKQQSKNNQDWEILSFTWVQNNPNNLIWGLQPNGLYKNNYGAEFTYYDMMHGNNGTFCVDNGKMKIHSVKVLSSGEIFSVGDITNHGKIIGFQLGIDNRIMLAETYSEGLIGLDKIEHKKQPLFTTDEIPFKQIFEHDTFAIVELPSYRVSKSIAMAGARRHPNQLYFSTEDAAKEYVQIHKPSLSLADVHDALFKGQYIPDDYTSVYKKLKELAKQKINQ